MKNIAYSLIDIYNKGANLCADLVYGLNYGDVNFEYGICSKTSSNAASKKDIESNPEFWADVFNFHSQAEFNHFNNTKEQSITNINGNWLSGSRYYLDLASSDTNLVKFYSKSEDLALEKLKENKDKIFRKDDIIKISESIKKFSQLYSEVLSSCDPGLSMKKVIGTYNQLGSFGEYTSFDVTIKKQRKESLVKELSESLNLKDRKESKIKL